MALEKIVITNTGGWALWKIEEDEEALQRIVGSVDELPPSIHNSKKRMEWLAGRVVVKTIMERLGLPFKGIVKDEFGKPFPKAYDYQLSLSHSYPYVGALIDREISVGIDLEQPQEKLLRVAPRVFHKDELTDAGSDLVKCCIYWCAKEALIKIYGKKDLTLAENLLISAFRRENEGPILGRIIVKDIETVIPLYYIVYPNFVVVLNKRNAS
jgi:4'-phosphopantetheinyl transferase